MRFTIAIVFRNAPDHLARCLEAVANYSGDDLEVFLWDNASAREAKDVAWSHLRSNGPVKVLDSATNQGFGDPMNSMLLQASGDYFVGLNSDCVVGEGWLEALAAPFERHAMVGLTGPRGGCREITPEGRGVAGQRLDYIEGSCFMIPTKLFREMGGFDTETFRFAYAEDADLCLRLRERGYKLVEVDVPGYEHERGVTRNAVLAEPGAPDLLGFETINNARLLTRWADYLKRGSFKRTIILERSGARGDVLWLTALARIVAARVPHWKLYAHTPFPELFEGNPLIFPITGPLREPAEIVNLNLAYERRPHEHISMAYAHALGVPEPFLPIGPQLFLDPGEIEAGRSLIGRYILVHTGRVGWKGREVPTSVWDAILRGVEEAFPDHMVLTVGADWPGTMRKSAALIAAADLFIGPSSFPLSLAFAVGTPAVGIFGSINPAQWLPPSGPFAAVQADGFACLGCHHELPPPRTSTDCPREPDADFAPCMRNIDPARVVEAAKRVIQCP